MHPVSKLKPASRDEESEDEEEEMRQAAVAMRKQNFEAKQEALRNVDIIDLLSEDSDEDMDLGKHKDQIPCSSHDAVWSTNPNSSHQTSWPHGLLLQSNKPKLPQYEVSCKSTELLLRPATFWLHVLLEVSSCLW